MFDEGRAAGRSAPWAAAAERLGLVLHDPIGAYERGASFSRLKRAMGAPSPSAGSSPFPWMYGRRRVRDRDREVEVIVVPNPVSDSTGTRLFPHALARVDPPLLWGLSVGLRSPLAGFGPATGDPAFDHAFTIDATVPERAYELFRRRERAPRDLVDRLLRLMPVGLSITDSVVDVFPGQEIVDVERIAAHLDEAAAIATELGDRRGSVSPPGQEARVGAWRSFATRASFGLDEDRMLLRGDVGGAKVRIGLEGEPCTLYTVVVADFPQLLGIGLRVTRHGPMDPLAELFGPVDVRVGDPPFDEAFALHASPPPLVHAVFANGAMRRALYELSLGAKDFTMDDARLYVRYPITVTQEQHLDGIVHRVRLILAALYPSGHQAGPYR